LYAVRRVFPGIIPAAVLSAAIAIGAAGCGSSPSHAASATEKASPSVASETPSQIATKAFANLKAATSLKITGSVTESGQDIGLDVTTVKNQGCAGTLSVAGTGSLQLVSVHSKVWIKPSDQFYKKAGASAFLQVVSGKWLAVTKSSDMGAFSKLCTVTNLVSNIPTTSAGVVKSTGPVIDGQPTVKLSDAADRGEAMYIADSATPELLRITVPGTGDLEFSGYGAHPTITTPPAANTVNGSQYGF
jgi:hypothetical protein